MFCIIFSDRENHERKERRNYLTTVTQNQTIQTPLKVKYTGDEHQKRGKNQRIAERTFKGLTRNLKFRSTMKRKKIPFAWIYKARQQ